MKIMFDTKKVVVTEDAEIAFLQRMRHPRMVMYLGCGRCEDGNIFVVLEYMPQGSLDSLVWSEVEQLTAAGKPSAIPSHLQKVKGRPRADSSGFHHGARDDGTSGSVCESKPLPKTVSWDTRLQILADIAEGMTHLHLVFFAVHRDLKSPNVLLMAKEGKLRAKVADFGTSRVLTAATRPASAPSMNSKGPSAIHMAAKVGEDARAQTAPADSGNASLDKRGSSNRDLVSSSVLGSTSEGLPQTSSHLTMKMTTGRGTPLWMAPEILASMGSRAKKGSQEKAVFSQAVDIYAFAIIMWETLALRQPWITSCFKWSHEVLQAVERGDRPLTPKKLIQQAPEGYCTLMKTCWDQSPKKRPRFDWIARGLVDVKIALHRQRCQKAKTISPVPKMTGSSSSPGSEATIVSPAIELTTH